MWELPNYTPKIWLDIYFLVGIVCVPTAVSMHENRVHLIGRLLCLERESRSGSKYRCFHHHFCFYDKQVIYYSPRCLITKHSRRSNKICAKCSSSGWADEKQSSSVELWALPIFINVCEGQAQSDVTSKSFVVDLQSCLVPENFQQFFCSLLLSPMSVVRQDPLLKRRKYVRHSCDLQEFNTQEAEALLSTRERVTRSRLPIVWTLIVKAKLTCSCSSCRKGALVLSKHRTRVHLNVCC